jgi:hypothetical protein
LFERPAVAAHFLFAHETAGKMAQEGCSFLTDAAGLSKIHRFTGRFSYSRPRDDENVTKGGITLAVRLPASLTILSKRSPNGVVAVIAIGLRSLSQ